MKVLLTGANGYIGRRLIPFLIDKGHEVVASVRDKNTLHLSNHNRKEVEVVEADFLKKETLANLPKKVDVAFYLIHSLGEGSGSFANLEKEMAENFVSYLNETNAKQLIYLGGISNDDKLSKHLSSRKYTEEVLASSKVPLTVLRAAIIIGSGGASFEIIRDLVEKLPIMVTPKWLNTKCQPIAIRNVIYYLEACIGQEKVFNKTFDIGGPEVLTYKEMLLKFAEVRSIKRYIFTLPVMTPRLSSYWLFFVTATSYKIAVNLVDSMKNEVIVKRKGIKEIFPQELLYYKEAVRLAFKRIEQNMVVSSWTDSKLSSTVDKTLNDFVQVPSNGTYRDLQEVAFRPEHQKQVLSNIWAIGGSRGWYYGNWLWKIRGYFDKLFGGVGLRRGRRSPTKIFAGDSLDFWRVLLADEEKGRLLLYAEMKLPGEAWLEFKLENKGQGIQLTQTATFRPLGLWGRLYWYAMLPFHVFIFENMAKNIVSYSEYEIR